MVSRDVKQTLFAVSPLHGKPLVWFFKGLVNKGCVWSSLLWAFIHYSVSVLRMPGLSQYGLCRSLMFTFCQSCPENHLLIPLHLSPLPPLQVGRYVWTDLAINLIPTPETQTETWRVPTEMSWDLKAALGCLCLQELIRLQRCVLGLKDSFGNAEHTHKHFGTTTWP